MTESNELLKSLDLLSGFSHLGKKKLDDGTHLIGRAPHIAPLAWLHSIYPPLEDFELSELEKKLGILIPDAYKVFLKMTNGLKVFSTTFYLYGFRKRNTRTVDDAWQPFDLWIPNVAERPENASSNIFFIGGYDWDGSHLYIDPKTAKVYLCGPENATPLYAWSSFANMLDSEIKRLLTLFDKDGKEISPDESTLIIDY